MEEPLLFIVENVFQISKRGCVLVPGLSAEPGSPTARVGSEIRLVTPQGGSIDTHIAGIELANYGARRPQQINVPILLAPDVSKEQVLKGTQVFLRAKAVEGGDGA